ncbi:MAG TPA: hypothetical protein P5545_03170 [Bacteroidota bacterium]|nr:hypothetical protein [Bacteroidota bacterium]
MEDNYNENKKYSMKEDDDLFDESIPNEYDEDYEEEDEDYDYEDLDGGEPLDEDDFDEIEYDDEDFEDIDEDF